MRTYEVKGDGIPDNETVKAAYVEIGNGNVLKFYQAVNVMSPQERALVAAYQVWDYFKTID